MSERGTLLPELLDRVVESTSRYNMFARGDRLGVAVSGGADSVCLLHLLAQLAEEWKLQLAVLHVDHRLRGEESAGDAEFVSGLAVGLGLPFYLREVDVAAMGGNLEEAARNARRAFFAAVRRKESLRCVATGHTRSDQAETVLFRLLRGAGAAGIAGIRPVTPDGIVRPLLEIDRGEVEDWLRGRGIAWREDRTNRDLSFARNRIRHQLLPELAASWNPQVIERLADMAKLAQEEEEYWGPVVEAAFRDVATVEGDSVVMRVEGLGRPALARRVVRRAVTEVRGDLRGIDFGHIDSILSLARRVEGHGRLQAPGIDVCRSFGWLRLAPAVTEPAECDYEYAVTVPATYTLRRFSVNISLATATPGNCDYNEKETDLDWDCLAGPLLLRNWRPGDSYEPAGSAGDQKIKSLFQEHRVPQWERRYWPVISAGGKIVWARRFGPARQCVVSPTTTRVLRIEIFPTDQ